MKQSTLSHWLKAIILGVGLCGLVVYALVLPMLGQTAVQAAGPEYAYCYWPWLVFLWLTAPACFAALVFAWRIAVNIGQNRSFSLDNARLMKWISWLAAGDAGFFFVGNFVMGVLFANHAGVLLFSLLFVFAGVAISVAAAALSHLIRKAAELQEQSDLTI